jgi:hypothetical protein
METKTFAPLHTTFRHDTLEAWPALRTCTSALEASRIMFGVQGMTRFIHANVETVQAIVAFFDGNHSDMIAWSKLASVEYSEEEWEGEHMLIAGPLEQYDAEDGRPLREWVEFDKPRTLGVASVDFNAEPEHRKAYKAMAKALGLPLTVRLTESHDFKDVVKGFEFLKATKKRWAAFEIDILDALKLWPERIHARMIHDYAVQKMKDSERAARPRRPRAPRRAQQARTYYQEQPVYVDGPLPEFPGLPTAVGDYKILIPSHDKDLRAIGDAQGHCVGTYGMGYADKIRRKQVCIFNVYRKSVGDGVCVEVALRGDKPHVLQAQGKAGRGPTDKEAKVINQLTATLQSFCNQE